jgi:hypothetical protein
MKAKRIVNIFKVFKNDDIRKYLTLGQKTQLLQISSAISSGRIKDGKKPGNNYHVCNCDEPYASEVLGLILCGETKKETSNKTCKYCKENPCWLCEYAGECQTYEHCHENNDSDYKPIQNYCHVCGRKLIAGD